VGGRKRYKKKGKGARKEEQQKKEGQECSIEGSFEGERVPAEERIGKKRGGGGGLHSCLGPGKDAEMFRRRRNSFQKTKREKDGDRDIYETEKKFGENEESHHEYLTYTYSSLWETRPAAGPCA